MERVSKERERLTDGEEVQSEREEEERKKSEE